MALFIDLKVVPQSGRQKFCIDKSGTLKCFITSPPEDGKANKEVIALIADAVGVPKKAVEIMTGLTSRKKRLVIDCSITYEQLLVMLGCGGIQKNLFTK